MIDRVRKSALSVQKWENCCYDCVYTDKITDEFSEQSSTIFDVV